jgi:hypothetical protein
MMYLVSCLLFSTIITWLDNLVQGMVASMTSDNYILHGLVADKNRRDIL